MTKLVIFDLDGTILDAYKAIQESLNFTLKSLGRPPVGSQAVRRAVGHGDVNFIRRFVRKDETARALGIYRLHHKKSLVRHSRLFPETIMVLNALKKRGYALAVASNRPKAFSNILLRHLGLKKYFKVALFGKDKNDIKPKPTLLLKILRALKVSKEEAVYVGDMTIDVYAGSNAGIRTVAVAGGSSSKAQLKKAKPFKIIKRLSDLLKIL